MHIFNVCQRKLIIVSVPHVIIKFQNKNSSTAGMADRGDANDLEMTLTFSKGCFDL